MEITNENERKKSNGILLDAFTKVVQITFHKL